MTPSRAPALPAVAAGEEGDDDAAEGDDAADDGLEDAADAADDGHDAAANGLQGGSDLREGGGRSAKLDEGMERERYTYAGDDGAHGCGGLFCGSGWDVVWRVREKI
ncbi:hypothetical protein OCS_04011 [Ophiocordyceps sinensis CO18]|uniref:Uncharacterized protein n=1 Tax=Ophiocordyceps sinensis (strain Co18 / CGMCC 3.14243) TaxID=911162 RepID=T5AEW6_OPHSC|nr:hypothetical protein OCS_04011 [Ophiocordyceps sinensis CO18]